MIREHRADVTRRTNHLNMSGKRPGVPLATQKLRGNIFWPGAEYVEFLLSAPVSPDPNQINEQYYWESVVLHRSRANL